MRILTFQSIVQNSRLMGFELERKRLDMTRLIDADALKAVFEEKSSEAVCGAELCKAIISRINEAPTVDAVPVRHGHWIFNPKDAIEMMFTLPKCSECGAESADGGNYCPNCGARMDEDETD